MRGEEQLVGNEIRLFTKIRKEFQTWEEVLLECAAKGKHRKPLFAADLRLHSLAFKSRHSIINGLFQESKNKNLEACICCSVRQVML